MTTNTKHTYWFRLFTAVVLLTGLWAGPLTFEPTGIAHAAGTKTGVNAAHTIYVRPGGTSRLWSFGNDTTPSDPTNTPYPITQISYYNVDWHGQLPNWILTRGGFEYSTNGGSSWISYTVSGWTTNYVRVAGTLWRFVDTTPGDTTTPNPIGIGWYLQGWPNPVGSGTSVVPDNPPTGITADSSFILTHSSVGDIAANLTPTDTGAATDGFWQIDSQSVPNLFTISFNAATGNSAQLKLGTGTQPAAGQTATVTVRYFDQYQTDTSGNPITGQGFSQQLTFTFVADATQDLNFSNDAAVSTYAPVYAGYGQPMAATLSTGTYVTAWSEFGHGNDAKAINGTSYDFGGIYAREYDATGAAVASAFPVTPEGDGVDSYNAGVAALNAGRYVVAYQTSTVSDGYDIAYRIVEANGSVGGELTANTSVAGDQTAPAVATLADGTFVIAWVSAGEIHAQKFTAAAGAKSGAELVIHAGTTDVNPAVAALSNGDYVVAWGDGSTGNASAVVSSVPSTVIAVNTDGGSWSAAGNGPRPRAAGLTGGGFVVAWDSYFNDLTNYTVVDIFFQRYTNAGVAQGGTVQANLVSTGFKSDPAIAALSGGGYVIAWQSDTGDYDPHGIFGRRFTSTGTAVDTSDFEINQYRKGDQIVPDVTPLAGDSFAAVWEAGASANYTFTPGIYTRVLLPAATPPTVTTNAALGITTARATLNGTINDNGNSTVVTFEYGLTTGYGSAVTATPSPVNTGTNTAVTAAISNLTPNTTYHFRVVGANSGGTVNGGDLTFTTLAAPPVVTTNAASGVTTATATLNGTVNALNASTTVTFEYGLTTGYGTIVTALQSPVSGSGSTPVSKGITGLLPNTSYHYRVAGTNSAGGTLGTDQSFTTHAQPPTVTTNAATSVTTQTVTLNGTVDALNASTTVTFEYGLTTGYGTVVTALQSPVSSSGDTPVSAAISNLTPNTIYHFRVVGANSGGTVNGGDLTFTTLAAPPVVTTNAASGVTTATATLNGTVNALNASTTVTFEYGLDTSYGTIVTALQSPVSGSGSTLVSKGITGLLPNTSYHYRVAGSNSAGGTLGTDQSFTTHAQPPTVTTNAATSVTTQTVTLNGTVDALNASTTVTFEYGLTTGYGTVVTALQSPVSSSGDTPVSAAISNLTPNTIYHFRVVGANSGGTVNGGDLTFTTLAAPPVVTTNAATSVTTATATLNGTVNALNASTTVTFEYGLDTSYGTIVTALQSPVSGSGSTPVSKGITGLLPNTSYHYRVAGSNSAGGTLGTDQSFTTHAQPPTVTTNAATSVTTQTVTLNGTVDALNASTTVTFEYGLTTGYGTVVTALQSPVSSSGDTPVSAAISNLTPNTIYHFRVVGANSGGTVNGGDLTFTTLAAPPVVTTNAASGVTTATATLNGTVNALNASTTVTFEYGLDTSYGTIVTALQSPVSGSGSTPVSKGITGLLPNTSYHYRVAGSNSAGGTLGTDQSFTTHAQPPTVTTNAATSVTTQTVALNGTVDALNASTTVTFEYGLTTGYGSVVTALQSPVSSSGDTPVSAAISNLTPNTTYHFRVVGANSGGTVNGGDLTFTTLAAPPVVTTNAASGVTTATATLNGTVNALNASTTVTFEYGLDTSYGTIVTALQSPVSGSGSTPVSKGITGLLPNTSYHYRVAGSNSAGGTLGTDQSFITTGPQLSLAKTVSIASPQAGSRLTYTVVVSNTGTGLATQALISDTLPAGLYFVGPITLEPPSAGVTGTLPTLASGINLNAGARVTVTFAVTVTTSLTGTQWITNTAAVTCAEISIPQTGQVTIQAKPKWRLTFVPLLIWP